MKFCLIKKICCVFTLLLTVATVLCTNAQTGTQQAVPPLKQLPQDTTVVKGVLDNGLTYYIRHNETPKGQVDFYIVQKVGSLQEDDNQQGLAHFLEHMCFHSTKNFPNDQLNGWLESKGVSSMAHLNAFTSTDRTVYNINNVPVSEAVVDSCLLILHDWSHDVSLDDKEIERERGVIHEEWRTRKVGFGGIVEDNLAKLMPNSRYAERLPIGKMEIVDNFKPQVLRDYYHKWYRPDLQAIVVVGDIDVKSIEAKIKKLFEVIPNPENEAEFKYYDVPDNDKTIYVCAKGKDLSQERVNIWLKHEGLPRSLNNTAAYYGQDVLSSVLALLLNERLADLTKSDNAPFAVAQSGNGTFLYSNIHRAFECIAVAGKQGIAKAYEALLTELRRAALYGFSQAELDRAKAKLKSDFDGDYLNRDKKTSTDYVADYVSNFLDNTPISGADMDYYVSLQVLQHMRLEVINETAKEWLKTDRNMVVLAVAPDKEDVNLPNEAELAKIEHKVKNCKIKPLEEKVYPSELMSVKPTAGTIVKEEKCDFNTTRLTLGNGAVVYLKKTDFKADEVILSAIAKGGESQYPASDHATIGVFNKAWDENGVGDYSAQDIPKVLAGKSLTWSLAIDSYQSLINGRCQPNSLEDLMQGIYLSIVKPRDNEAEFVKVLNENYAPSFKNKMQDPQYVFQDSLKLIAYNHNEKAKILGYDSFAKFDYKRAQQILKESFGNASDFVFTIVGNYDEDSIRGLVAQYIATLPSTGKCTSDVKNDGKEFVHGKVSKTFHFPTENNYGMICTLWVLNDDYTLENKVKLSIVKTLFDDALFAVVRQKEGAVYSANAVATIEQTWQTNFTVSTGYPFNADKVDIVKKANVTCFTDIEKNVSQMDIDNVKEQLLGTLSQAEIDNDYWTSIIAGKLLYGVDMYTQYRDVLAKITVGDIKKFVRKFVDKADRVEVVMVP